MKLNPNQIPIVTADKPVYGIAKQVQWNYPEKFESCFLMLRPLHIEMAFLNAIGDWLEGSGWTGVFQKANFNKVGRIESFLSGSKIKRSRYAYQVSLAALVTMSNIAFESQNDIGTYGEWSKKTYERSVNALYWFTVIDLEVLLFMFVRSLREANFRLFISCLSSICTWMFALDHVHYARWLPVFINNLSFLRDKSNLVFDAFLNGFFTVRQSERPFSNMATDQAHEQNNKLVKIDGGAVGILDNEAALLKWPVASPIISEILQDQEPSNPKDKNILKHHENTKSFEKFKKDKEAFQNAFLKYGNPF